MHTQSDPSFKNDCKTAFQRSQGQRLWTVLPTTQPHVYSESFYKHTVKQNKHFFHYLKAIIFSHFCHLIPGFTSYPSKCFRPTLCLFPVTVPDPVLLPQPAGCTPFCSLQPILVLSLPQKLLSPSNFCHPPVKSDQNTCLVL